MATISASVGRGGKNNHPDVITVQQLLRKANADPGMVDGRCGPKTINAIIQFQKRFLREPDGLIEVGKTTWQRLNAAAGNPGTAPQPPFTPSPGGAPGSSPAPSSVVYSDRLGADEKIVHAYSFKVLEMVMSNAGCPKAVITSTIRTPAKQVDIMYRHAKINLQGQYALYGPTGDKVLKVYEDHKHKPEPEVKALMVAKIEELAKLGQRVSLHVTTPALYATRNIIDIGVNSTQSVAGGCFDKVKITAAFKQAERDGYIDRFIDETNKTNNCWHAEISPNKKPLPTL